MSRLNTPIVLLSLVLSACGGGGGGSNGGNSSTFVPDTNSGAPQTITVAPENTGDGWEVSTPAAESMDETSLRSTLEAIRDSTYPGVDSMVVVRNGRIIAEGYFNGFARDSIHDLRSTGKSFTSALAGIAAEQGLIAASQPISNYIPQFDTYAQMSDRKRAIKISDLLNMASGLDCNDANPASPGNEENMYPKSNWVKFVLDLPMVAEPGSTASYCTGGVVVLGHIVALRSGGGLDTFANTHLFGPLGITRSEWRRSPDGAATGGGGLKLRPRDLAKFGSLYLTGGTWNGVRVLPEAWVQQSRQRVNNIGSDGYGYLWWKRDYNSGGVVHPSVFTSGNGGNLVILFPADDLLIAFTGSNYNTEASNRPYQIVAERILPALR